MDLLQIASTPVSFRVLNKTTDEYRFLVKINITAADGDVKILARF